MLTLKDIIQFLEPNQVKIPNKAGATESIETNFPTFVTEFIEKYLPKDIQFYTCPPIGKNSFMASFLYMTDPKFPLYRPKERDEAINELRKIMGYQLDEKNLHSQFNYTRKRKFKKADLQKNLFHLQKPLDEIYAQEMISNPINQYLVDYFSVNIFIINATTQKIMTVFANLDNPNRYKPSFFFFMDQNLFYPLVAKDVPYFVFSQHQEFLEQLYTKFSKIKTIISDDDDGDGGDDEGDGDDEGGDDEGGGDDGEGEGGEGDDKSVVTTISEPESEPEPEPEPAAVDLNKLTVKELQKMVSDKGISIWKKSDKTAKNIFKKKDELIADLQ